ncbi:S8 family peptidase [Actinomadura xylanilytica]|uniref:S8 family peptidase n=1 Tax=Actinomadura xylanilytica TaxID=887459 RepID=UPI00255B3D06|nr:S8 family serine peptidase [Actinomadura xylanilytica]MDL4772869.1 S8 family serine peptidase [Actinomadura xylanilytica]
MRWTAVAVVTGGLAALVAVPMPAQAAAGCPSAPESGGLVKNQITDTPWAQKLLPLAEAQEKADGHGVKIAVIDSGVDTTSPQLAGQAVPTVDLTGTGRRDCVGHGTEVAGIIAAKPKMSLFVGVAPGARIIPIKYAATATNNDDRLLVKGIDEAVRRGAQIINISSETHTDTPELRQAVTRAQNANILIVAAAGNVNPKKGGSPTPSYPAQYSGVLSVGAIAQDGQVTQFSNTATRVSVIAPGKDILTIAPGGGYIVKGEGTSFATPFVAGVAALVKQTHPRLTAAQLKQRIEATADGQKGAGSGYGVVNPLAAVTAVIDPNTPLAPASEPGSVRLAVADKPDPAVRNTALGIGLGGLGLAALVVAGGVLIPAGRRRGWRPGWVTQQHRAD